MKQPILPQEPSAGLWSIALGYSKISLLSFGGGLNAWPAVENQNQSALIHDHCGILRTRESTLSLGGALFEKNLCLFRF